MGARHSSRILTIIPLGTVQFLPMRRRQQAGASVSAARRQLNRQHSRLAGAIERSGVAGDNVLYLRPTSTGDHGE